MRKQGVTEERNEQLMEGQITQNGSIPLIVTNQGAIDGEEEIDQSDVVIGQPIQRKRSRAISTVSMSSNTGETPDVQSSAESATGGKNQKQMKLHQLILNGNVEEADKLLSKGGEVNNKDNSGKTPLHTAILTKQLKIMEKLLECGADVTMTDDAGDTPLHTAVRVGSETIVQTLLQRGTSDPNATGRNSSTPLHLAAGMDSDSICKILIDDGGDMNRLDDDQMTSVGHAVERGASKSAEYLLQRAQEQATVEGFLYDVDLDGNTLLHLAVNSGVLAVVKLCVECGARIRQPRRTNKVTAFHMACEQGSMPIVEYLASIDPAVCRITLVDKKGYTPLHMAASKNHIHVVEFLLEKGAALDPKCDERSTPLLMAADQGATDVVKLLMERGADLTIRDIELRSVLHAAVGHPRTMEALLQSPAVMSLITEKDATGFSAVHYAAKKGDVKNVALFVAKNKAAASVTSDSLDTPIHVAAKYGWTEVIEKLMDGAQNARIPNLQNSQGKTALHFACSEGSDLATELLLRLGATIERDKSDRTPLHCAAVKGSKRCCEIILQKFESCINALDKQKNSALHLAAINGNSSVVSILLSNEKAQVTMNSLSQNILDAAVKENKDDVVMVIAGHVRWREVLTTCSAGVVPMLQKLVEIMPNSVLRFLDQLIEETGDPASTNYKVKYDLGLIQGKYERAETPTLNRLWESGKKNPSEDEVKVINNQKNSTTDPAGETNSLALIETMAKYRREKCLTHSISFLLLNTKWKKFGWLTFAFNLFTYLLFIVPLTTLAVYTRVHEDELCGFNSSDPNKDNEDYTCTFSNVGVQILNYFVMVMAVCHLLKEVVSLFHLRLSYFGEVSNYFEWVCYISAILYNLPPCDCRAGYKRQVGSIALFFGWINLTLYFRRLSSYGPYVIMITKMFQTLAKVLLLWMLFIVAFGTTFLMLMDEVPFDSLGSSLMTMYVMTLGELNYADNFMPWDSLPFPTLTNVLFIVLVLGMPIIMMNMLVGLAVGDIGQIQKNALMDRYVLQVQLLVDIENSLPKFILKRVEVYNYIEFPNHPTSLRQKLIDSLVGFEGLTLEADAEEEISPAMSNILDRINQQDVKMQKMYDVLKEQSESLKELSRRKEREKEQEDQKGESKSLWNIAAKPRLIWPL